MAPGKSEEQKAAQAAYVQRNKEQIAATKAAWRGRNKERIAAYNAAYKQRNREQLFAQRRVYEPLRRQRVKAGAAKRRAAVERVKAYAAANPAETARRKREWAANNPEKVKKAQREYLKRNRAAVQQRADAWRTANPERIANYPSNRSKDPDAVAESNRQRRADPATYAHDLQVNRDRRRLIRRLTAKGLPPPRVQRLTASKRRVNGIAAEIFSPVLAPRSNAATSSATTVNDLHRKSCKRPLETGPNYAANPRYGYAPISTSPDTLTGSGARSNSTPAHGKSAAQRLSTSTRNSSAESERSPTATADQYVPPNPRKAGGKPHLPPRA